MESMSFQNWKQQVAEALNGMLYISESEAPLLLLDVGAASAAEHVREFIQSDSGAGKDAPEPISAEQFLSEIHKSADPADAILQENAARFDKLFELLKEGDSVVLVLRVADRIYIAATRPEGSVLIRTEVVET